MQKRSKTAVIILLVITLLLGISAVILGYFLTREEQAPEDISASDGRTCCDNQCSRSDICWCAHLTGVGANKCTPEINANEWICGAGSYDGRVCYTCPTNHPAVPDHLEGQVLCTEVGASDCSAGKAACVTTPPSEPEEPTPTKKVCGEACTRDADCIDYGTGGDRVQCINNVCSNVLCPGGEEKGTICNCLGGVSCGEYCGYGAAGLCGDGISSCRYLDSSCPAGGQKAVCYPVARETKGTKYYDAGFDAEWDSPGGTGSVTACKTRDTGNAYIRNNNTGRTTFSKGEIEALCKWCGNYKLEAGEECDPPGTVVNGKTCGTDCKFVAEPVPSCGDGVIGNGEACDYNATPTGCGSNETCTNDCVCQRPVEPPIESAECQVLEGDTSDVAPGEFKIFRLVVDYGTTTVPGAGSIVLRVSSVNNDTPVGRDGYHTPTTALVLPINNQPLYFDPQNNKLGEYQFVWQATNVDGSNLTNADYDVEVSLNGGDTWISVSSCKLTFTFDSSEEADPNFLIIKEGSAASCSTTNGVDIVYTINVTNLGPTQGTLDFVEDQLDQNVQDSWVTNITTSAGVEGILNAGTIRWTGTESQRTYTVDQTETFGYTLSVPASSLSVFNTGVPNIATVVFGNDQNRYNLLTNTGCFGDLPSTAIIDETPWIVALLAVALGLVVLKLDIGTQTMTSILTTGNKVIVGTMEAVGLEGINRQKTKKKLEDRFTK